MNKIDKPEAIRIASRPSWPVTTSCPKSGVAIASSSTFRQRRVGIDDLLEAILIQAEVLELKAVVDGMGQRRRDRILPG